MPPIQVFLAEIWYGLLGVILVLYVVLDGFTLGVGILSLFERGEEQRGILMNTLGSVWDANETWLVLLGGALFGAFPMAYGVLLHALYVPLLLMLFGLIFRGAAFEFREHAARKRIWELAFGLGSLVTALAQGLALGGILQGLPVAQGKFTGGAWEWLRPFAVWVALGVVAGYALLGATYLVVRTEGKIQERAYRRARVSAFWTLLVAAGVTVWTPFIYPYVAEKWFSLPTFFVILPLPIAALASFAMLLRAIRKHFELAPFMWSLAIFFTSFTGLATSLHPYLIPPRVTLEQAAASPQTLVFMLTGIGMLLPVMMIYNGYQYLVFRGKVRSAHYGGQE